MSVAFEELAGSPTLHVGGSEIVGQRVFKVGWSDRYTAVNQLWGAYAVISGVPTFTPPSYFPDVPSAVATDIRIEPFDRATPLGLATLTDFNSGENTYESARLTVTYRSQPDGSDSSHKPHVPDGTILIYTSDLASEYLTVPGRTWRWSVAGSPPVSDDITPGILIPCEDIQLSWRRVPLPPWDAIRELRGKINDDTFMGHNAGTVMLLGAHIVRDFQFLDTGLWRIDYHFKTKEVKSTVDGLALLGWNNFYRQEASGGEHWLGIEDIDGHPPYVAGDFTALFAFGS